MRKFALVALFAATVATPAMAQATYAEGRAPFTGPRAEGIVGWDRLSDGTGSDAGSSEGIVYGGQVGYDIQAGRAVVGVEGELTGSTTDTRADSLLVGGDRLVVDAGRDLYVGGRVGIAVTPRALVYAKAGYTNARVETDYRAGTTRINDHLNLDGYRLGAGIEYGLAPNMYVKGEYRYSNYGSADGYDIDLDRNQVLGGIGIRF